MDAQVEEEEDEGTGDEGEGGDNNSEVSQYFKSFRALYAPCIRLVLIMFIVTPCTSLMSYTFSTVLPFVCLVNGPTFCSQLKLTHLLLSLLLSFSIKMQLDLPVSSVFAFYLRALRFVS